MKDKTGQTIFLMLCATTVIIVGNVTGTGLGWLAHVIVGGM